MDGSPWIHPIRSVFEMKTQQAAQNLLEGPTTTTTGSSNTLGVPNNNTNSSPSFVDGSTNDPSLSSTSGTGHVGGLQQISKKKRM